MSAAYLIAELSIREPGAFADYAARTAGIIALYGGETLIGGGSRIFLEGEREMDNLVVVRFPSTEQALAFYESPEYAPLLEIRASIADAVVLLADGRD